MAMYDQNRHLISQYNVVPAPRAQLVGVFLLLDKVKGLFEEQFMEMNKGHYCHSNQIDKYPVGHLLGVGCIQTQQPLPLLFKTVRKINRTLGAAIPPESDEEVSYSDIDEFGCLQ